MIAHAATRSASPVAARRRASGGVHIDLQRRVTTWAPRRAEIAAWANEALGRRAANREVSVRLVGRAESRKLNSHYRGKDYATNVLSFPTSPMAVKRAASAAAGSASAEAARPLGDLVICPPVLRAEAHEQRKTLRAHWAHLVVHGALHLIGYDHERDADARRMERREIAVLRRLGFANPYRSA
jgi:probable rRNA maturation factor